MYVVREIRYNFKAGFEKQTTEQIKVLRRDILCIFFLFLSCYEI